MEESEEDYRERYLARLDMRSIKETKILGKIV